MFFRNGNVFLASAARANRRNVRETYYALAIATELVLKAFLVAHGWSDDRCRREVRHDLAIALGFAKAVGLDTPLALDGVVEVLNAFYPNHAFDQFVVPPGKDSFPAIARAMVAGLIEKVGRDLGLV